MITETSRALAVRDLRKLYGDQVAVAGLTLTVERGEVFGFLGPNGAGKTTSLKMFLGLVAPTAGEGQLLGMPLGDPRGRARVGFLPEHFRFHDWLTAAEFLKLHADLYHMPADVARRRIPDLLERVGLLEFARRKLRTFSKGMLQRVGLAQALLNEPELVLLDEPTSGLDPMGRRLVRDIIRDLREKGTAVFLNSHLLSEIEVTADRVAFIRHGEVVHTRSIQGTGTLDALIDGELTVKLRVRPRVGAAAWTVPAAVLQGLQRWGEHVHAEGDTITMVARHEADLPLIARYIFEQGLDLYTLTPQKLSLEDLFVEVVGQDGGL